MSKAPVLVVLAGVNGAGKSSIAGEFLDDSASFFFNPDIVAKKIQSLHPDISVSQANAHAWQIGRDLLEQAISHKRDYRFETTLGGRTIPRLLEHAARSGHQLHVWFCGLTSPELHIKRVKSRVAHGGHDIPGEIIRRRWTTSRENLVRLLPFIDHLRMCDNSYEADPNYGLQPRPVLLLEWKHARITALADPATMPEWAQPIVAAAHRLVHT